MFSKQNKGILKNFISLFYMIIILSFILLMLRLASITGIFPHVDNVVFTALELALLSMLIIVVCVTLIRVNRAVLIPLTKFKSNIEKAKSENTSYYIEVDKGSEIHELACAFNDMSASLQQSYNKLESQTLELNDKNWELQEANTELEASYGQLQAIIEQLNEAEQKYHSLIKNIPEVVCVIEDTGLVSFVNHACYEVLGYEKSDLVGKDINDLIALGHETFSVNEILNELSSSSVHTTELTLLRKDGVSIITEVNFTNFLVNGINMGLQAIIRDITKRRKLQKEIIQSNKELSILNSVSKSLTSTLDLDELCNVIVNEISQTLECPGCLLSLADNDTSTLRVKAVSGEFIKHASEEKVFESLSMTNETVRKLFNGQATIKAEDIPEECLVGKLNRSLPADMKFAELLSVPVAIKDKKLGTIIVCFSSPVGEHEINLITSIANNAAVAIDNALLYETSKKYFIKTVDALIATVEAKDDYTEGHSQRVSKYAVDIAEKLGLPKEQIEDIKVAGMLHDIGKIGISDAILLKPGKLTPDEYEVIKQHPFISNKILYPVGFSDRTMKAIAFHHERFDGRGYPYGLSGNEISIEAQIIAVADAYDAMTSSRSYRMSMSSQDALRELTSNKHTQFSPQVVDAFLEVAKNYKSFVY